MKTFAMLAAAGPVFVLLSVVASFAGYESRFLVLIGAALYLVGQLFALVHVLVYATGEEQRHWRPRVLLVHPWGATSYLWHLAKQRSRDLSDSGRVT